MAFPDLSADPIILLSLSRHVQHKSCFGNVENI